MQQLQQGRNMHIMRAARFRSIQSQSRILKSVVTSSAQNRSASLKHHQLSAAPASTVAAPLIAPFSNKIANIDLAYDLVQGPLVRLATLGLCTSCFTAPAASSARWCEGETAVQIQRPVRYSRQNGSTTPPTAVFVHGILGSRRNLQSFATRFVQAHPCWQVLLIDLRCHGESAALSHMLPGSHNVGSAASDVLKLLRNLKLFPNALVGHSFGGKVVMEMVHQFGQRLPRPVQVWVLDTLPGEVRAGEAGGLKDHPRDLISTLLQISLPITNRTQVLNLLTEKGFSPHIAQWVCTNLRPDADKLGLQWTFDLPGIYSMYDSYESFTLWPLLQQPPQGLKLDFVKAERSSWRWEGEEEARIMGLGHQVHLLRNAGHWVHTDNPQGLLDIMSPSFLHIGPSCMKS